MNVLKLSSAPFHFTSKVNKTQLGNQCFQFHLLPSSSSSSINRPIRRFKLCASTPSTISTESANPLEEETKSDRGEGKFDWYAQWYPVMPICDLDKRVPHAKKVIGIDVVVWWDRNESAWKVFDDACPHRLAPLSEGRIDQWGRLQCVYHGWCFNGSGDCKFIPQAPPDGPPVHKSKRACVAVYPSIVQNDILWFWPNSDPQYKDILVKKRPPYIPELDDPSYTKLLCNRDLSYGYEVLLENLMDPAHVPYAHYGIMRAQQPKRVKADREGGQPIEMVVRGLDINGFTTIQQYGSSKFVPPCLFYSSFSPDLISKEGNPNHQDNGTLLSAENDMTATNKTQRRVIPVLLCIPVSPGKSRVIFAFPRNFAVWIDRIIPRWMFHVGQNLIMDSDLYLLHVEEKKILDIGPSNWLKASFVPTESDAQVVAFRRWLYKYSDGCVDWLGKFSGGLLPSPPREQLMDRYWSHVVNCSSCRVAYKGLNALEVVLQVISIASLGILAATTKQSLVSGAARIVMVAMAILCFAASRWLSHFIYKNFHFHDYNHALR